MKLRCPKDPTHKRFSATAHEVRGWIVDEDGAFIESDGDGCSQVASGPDYDSSECMICGEEAEFGEADEADEADPQQQLYQCSCREPENPCPVHDHLDGTPKTPEELQTDRERSPADLQADWEESQAENWARHPRREQRDRTD